MSGRDARDTPTGWRAAQDDLLTALDGGDPDVIAAAEDAFRAAVAEEQARNHVSNWPALSIADRSRLGALLQVGVDVLHERERLERRAS